MMTWREYLEYSSRLLSANFEVNLNLVLRRRKLDYARTLNVPVSLAAVEEYSITVVALYLCDLPNLDPNGRMPDSLLQNRPSSRRMQCQID